MRVYFSDNVKFFKIKEIDVIGNTNNNTLIGLEPDSFDFINQINKGYEFEYHTLSEENKKLIDTLFENGFVFKEESEAKNKQNLDMIPLQ